MKSVALRLLARRDFGRAELAERLRARGGDEADITAALDQLAALGFVSDVRTAESVVASRRGSFGRRAIAQALKDRRIAPDTAAAALAPLDGADEAADAWVLWQRRFGTAPRDQREKARHVRFLMSRGYPMSVAFKVLRMAGAAVEQTEDDAS
jgi:regulatory protein